MNALPSLLETSLPLGSIEAYVKAIKATPVLSKAEEHGLAKALKENQDLLAAKKLILANLRYVLRIAYQYRGYGLALADLIQEGTIGLMKAVKRFDPAHDVKLISFAIHWIKSEMHDFIIRNWRIVKVATTKSQRKLFFNLRRAKKSLNWLTRYEMKEIAKDLNVPIEDVQEMEMRL